ncbi:hypothetical protein Q4577_08785 [Marinovum sp. 2_MG-2023]|uniref:hypothetical protein n=1 Tax=Roseobacteraceae TaxID=2854170 RepID=UPI001FD216CB|nr:MULTISPECIES: hypothetical protein [Roseobacteraceae]MCJ7872873.1 hypothetical protein [Phaeobacter sp. J2-8]MCJ7872874.1 hypothetical protein [Phaeobacter sp. J2-8]MCJ7872876.1 hypothetical protein [Phaeobacter sp. J2-8]MCJ7872877.1 hypothetical protein [Phaeobacter sp. J2-8]MDO6730112.1 hypothetical protein [Marinovum sp. 2_MG-2023]
MKNIIAITALALAGFATTASAMTQSTTGNLQQIERYAPNADLSNLSDERVALILATIHSGDSDSEVRSTVRSLVAGS